MAPSARYWGRQRRAGHHKSSPSLGIPPVALEAQTKYTPPWTDLVSLSLITPFVKMVGGESGRREGTCWATNARRPLSSFSCSSGLSTCLTFNTAPLRSGIVIGRGPRPDTSTRGASLPFGFGVLPGFDVEEVLPESLNRTSHRPIASAFRGRNLLANTWLKTWTVPSKRRGFDADAENSRPQVPSSRQASCLLSLLFLVDPLPDVALSGGKALSCRGGPSFRRIPHALLAAILGCASSLCG